MLTQMSSLLDAIPLDDAEPAAGGATRMPPQRPADPRLPAAAALSGGQLTALSEIPELTSSRTVERGDVATPDCQELPESPGGSSAAADSAVSTLSCCGGFIEGSGNAQRRMPTATTRASSLGPRGLAASSEALVDADAEAWGVVRRAGEVRRDVSPCFFSPRP